MKLVLKEYLASLGERGELDAILPDLLSQMGLNIFSRPGRGTRQDGVDVGAVGSMDGGPEKVYLLSIKPGDLTRATWDSASVQSTRPSLNEIRDAYIPNRLPSEHRDKGIVICVCVGGDVQEQVRPALEGFIKQNATDRIAYEQWNGDRLAGLIEDNFLREDLVPSETRSLLRKSLAMLDQPDISYKHFAALTRALAKAGGVGDRQALLAIRQMALCLWILFSWARKEGNMESAYLSGELALLHAWQLARAYAGKTTKTAESVMSTFTLPSPRTSRFPRNTCRQVFCRTLARCMACLALYVPPTASISTSNSLMCLGASAFADSGTCGSRTSFRPNRRSSGRSNWTRRMSMLSPSGK
jgi:hypothetical protein